MVARLGNPFAPSRPDGPAANARLPTYCRTYWFGERRLSGARAVRLPLAVQFEGLGASGQICSAISNTIYNATGKRVRDLPITLDKLL